MHGHYPPHSRIPAALPHARRIPIDSRGAARYCPATMNHVALKAKRWRPCREARA